AVAILDELVAEEPHNGMFALRLGELETRLAGALLVAKRNDEVETHIDAAIRILEARVAVDAGSVDAKKRLSLAYSARVELEQARGNRAAAEADARGLLVIDQRIYDAGAGGVEERLLLMRDHANIGEIVASDPKRIEEARQLLNQALDELDAIKRDGKWLASFDGYRAEIV